MLDTITVSIHCKWESNHHSDRIYNYRAFLFWESLQHVNIITVSWSVHTFSWETWKTLASTIQSWEHLQFSTGAAWEKMRSRTLRHAILLADIILSDSGAYRFHFRLHKCGEMYVLRYMRMDFGKLSFQVDHWKRSRLKLNALSLHCIAVFLKQIIACKFRKKFSIFQWTSFFP